LDFQIKPSAVYVLTACLAAVTLILTTHFGLLHEDPLSNPAGDGTVWAGPSTDHGPLDTSERLLLWHSEATSPVSGPLIAYAGRSATSSSDILVVPAAGGMARNLTRHPARDTLPTWSPDGSQIAFIRYDDHHHYVCVAGVQGGPRPRALSGPLKGACELAWHPSGRRLAYRGTDPGGASAIRLVALDGVTTTIGDGAFRDREPQWSPSGDALAFVRFDGSRSEIMLSGPSGEEPKPLLSDPGHYQGLAWSPDGRSLAAVHVVQGQPHRIVVLRPDTALGKVFDVDQSLRPRLRWTPDSRKLVAAAEGKLDWDVVLVDARTGRVEPVTKDMAQRWSAETARGRTDLRRTAIEYEAEMGPSGDELLFLSDLSGPPVGLFVMTLDGGGIKQLASDVTAAAWQPVPTP
jgi:Tol biopolymer transport system component